MKREITLWQHNWPMTEPFVIARSVQTSQPTLQIRLHDEAGHVGRGEACGVPYAGETPAVMTEQLRAAEDAIASGAGRGDLVAILPSGGARHLVDAALWDMEAKRDGTTAFAMAGLQPSPVLSACTIGMRSIDQYRATAKRLASYPLLKVKVSADNPLAAIAAVHEAAPDARLIIDPNQSWSVGLLQAVAPCLERLGVVLIEQPISVGAEVELDGWTSPIPLCADELINDIDDLPAARGRFQYINIKLDKSGGLTAALALADAAEAQGFGLMVGCMAGSSLSMAPAMVLAQRCAFVDLDGPLLQSSDIENGFSYRNGRVERPLIPELWG